MEKIDELDRKILKIITRNARIPFKDVAEKCGVSRAAIHQRVQKMFDNNVITGSGYQVDPQALGYNLCVLIGVQLASGVMDDSVVAELEKIPEVVDEFYTLGAYSIMLRVYARDNKHLVQLLAKIHEINGISKTETLTCLEQRINRPLPIGKE